MRIWAHRGCSQMYPENTLTSFEKAMNIPGLAGIELDIQLTRDGELVVIHDEKVDRTTDGYGFVRDYSLKELKSFHIHTGEERSERIPTMREVFELLSPSLKAYDPGNPSSGLRLNIELKNSIYPYPGMEKVIVDMVHEFGVEKSIVYSTFYAESLLRVHELDPEAELGVLDSKVSDCLHKALGLEKELSDSGNASDKGVTFDLHPYGNTIDIDCGRFEGRTVRAWFKGHLYPEKPTGGVMDLAKYEAMGITDVFLNEPEKYLK